MSGVRISPGGPVNYRVPLESAGYSLVDNVTAGLHALVLADPSSNSSKATKARKLGINVISEDGLIELLSAGE